MTNPHWWSQPNPPEGAVSGSGVERNLDNGNLHPLAVLVREAAQNSWDAATANRVDFSISLERLGPRAEAWNSIVGATNGPPTFSNGRMNFHERSVILTISDRGTSGLNGPIFADQSSDEHSSRNFIKFLRDVGAPNERKHGGGTYGYGKAIFYGISQCSAILVSTKCAVGPDRRRLMGAALSPSYFDDSGTPYTGRHWWGVMDETKEVIGPLLEKEADRIADDLGLPSFDDSQSGTDIIIILPTLNFDSDSTEYTDEEISEASSYLHSAILWNLWPKLGSSVREPQMSARVSFLNRTLPIRRPDEYSFLAPFAASLDEVLEGRGNPIVRKKGTDFPGTVGHWAMADCLADPSQSVQPGLISARPFEAPYHHIARMRQPLLVVDYMPGVTPTSSDKGYAAVFVAAPEFDDCFAASEPPTHDDWRASGLRQEKPRKVVKHARTRLFQDVNPSSGAEALADSSDLAGLGNLSSRLSSLVPFTGRRNSLTGRKDGKSGDRAASTGMKQPTVLEPPRLQKTPEGLRLLAKILPPSDFPESARLVVNPCILLDNGRREKDPPTAAPIPKVLSWFDESGRKISACDSLDLEALTKPESPVTLELSRVPNAVVGIKVEVAVDGT